MLLTNHAQRRKRQRGFNDFTLGIVERYGRHELAPGGAIKITLFRREYQQLVTDLKGAIQALDKAKNATMILNGNMVLTLYNRRGGR